MAARGGVGGAGTQCQFWVREASDAVQEMPLDMQRVEEGLTVERRTGRTVAGVDFLDPCSIAPSVRPGLPIQQLHVAGCCVCDTVYADLVDLRHALRCKHQHGPSRVHDEVKFAVAKISKASAEVVTMEDDMLLPGKRVDVAIRRPMDREAHALEISVADPLSLSSSLVEQCGRSMGVAAKEWERRKANDYVPFLESNRGVQFTPLIVETWGCLGGCFRRWLSQ
ncbi:unnamed protein product [Closterium sp. NIES-54]